MENHPVFKYYKNYIKINGQEFLWESISVSNGKRIVIDNLNGYYRPVLQYLGPRETNIRITIRYGGIYKTNSKYRFTNTDTSDKSESLKNSFLDQKNFIQNLVNSEKSKNVKIEFPDGDVGRGVLLNRTKTYSEIGLNTEELEFILLQPIQQSESSKSSTELKETTKSFFDKIKDIKNELTEKYYNTKEWIHQNVLNNITKVQNVVTEIQSGINNALSLFSDVALAVDQIGNVVKQVGELAKTPQAFVNGIQDVFESVKRLVGTTKDTLDLFKNCFDITFNPEADTSSQRDYNPSDVLNQDTDSGIKEQYYNLNDLTNRETKELARVQTNSVIFYNCLDMSIDLDYANNEEILETVSELNEMYEDLINSKIINYDIKETITTAYNDVKTYLLNDVMNSSINIKTLEVKTPRTLSKILYELYGSDDLFDDVLALNKDTLTDVLYVVGTIKVYDI